jgi:hypothetical protein
MLWLFIHAESFLRRLNLIAEFSFALFNGRHTALQFFGQSAGKFLSRNAGGFVHIAQSVFTNQTILRMEFAQQPIAQITHLGRLQQEGACI